MTEVTEEELTEYMRDSMKELRLTAMEKEAHIEYILSWESLGYISDTFAHYHDLEGRGHPITTAPRLEFGSYPLFRHDGASFLDHSWSDDETSACEQVSENQFWAMRHIGAATIECLNDRLLKEVGWPEEWIDEDGSFTMGDI